MNDAHETHAPAVESPRQARSYPPEDSRRKSPVLATLMSLAPGLGQVYVGYYREGFMHILVVASIITLLQRGGGDLTPFLGIFLAFFWLYNLVDAGRRASHYNLALAGLAPTEVPEGVRQLKGRNSLASGLALIAFGGILLAHTRFGFSLNWLEHWWPIALVVTGVYLVVQSYLDRRLEKTNGLRGSLQELV